MQSIMKDNELFFKTWMSYNPEFQNHLQLMGSHLVYQDENLRQEISIESFYLPDMLYNENFRNQISVLHELSSKDFFQIVKLYVDTNTLLETEQKELLMYPTIENIEIKEKNGERFLAITDQQNKKYRYNAENLENVMERFEALKAQKGVVSLKDFGNLLHPTSEVNTRNTIYQAMENPSQENEGQIHEYQEYILNGTQYEDYAPPLFFEMKEGYEKEIQFLQGLKEKSPMDTKYDMILNKHEEILKATQHKDMGLALKKENLNAGYTNASILIFVVVNLGLFLASILLLLK